MKLLCPWNLPSYVPANGFHPIYAALFDKESLPAVCFDLLKAEQLLNDPGKPGKAVRCECEKITKRFRNRHKSWALAEQFLHVINPSSQALTSICFHGTEFHHTVPYTALERPFIFHAESFMPTFMPFAFQGIGCLPHADEIRNWYGKIFSSDCCLGIWSHLQVTLDQFSGFFRNPTIS